MDDHAKSKEDLITELQALRQQLFLTDNSPIKKDEPEQPSDNLRLFRSFFYESPEGMALVSEEGEFLQMNPAFSELLGYAQDELLKLNATTIWANPADRSDWRALIDGQGRFTDFQALMRKKDGSVLHCLITSTRIRSDTGTIYQTILRDITDRKIPGSKLEEALELNEKIRSSSPIGILTYRPDGQCSSANEAACALIGATLDQVLSQNFRELRSWKESGLFQAAEETLLTGDSTRRVVRMETSFGKEVWLESRFARFLSEERAHLLVCLSDVNELKRSEEDSEALFRKYFELGRIGMAITSPEKGWVRVNDQICDLLGYSREELTRMTWAEMTHPDDLAADVDQFKRLMTGEIDGYSMEKRFIRKDGASVDTSLHVGCIRNNQGNVENVIAHIEDITARKRNERELLHRAKELKQRVKELNCLHEVSKLIEKSGTTHDEMLQGIVALVPLSWQYPEIVCGRIVVEDREYTTDGFSEGVSRQTSDIYVQSNRIGTIEIHYLEKKPEMDEGPFLSEERQLIDSVARMLGAAIQRKRDEEEVIADREQLLSVFDGIEDVIYVADPETYELLYVNEVFRSIWGDDTLGKICFGVLQGRTEPCPFCTNDKIFGDQLGRAYVWEFQNEIGKRWYRCSDKAIRWMDGRTVRFELAADITEQKETEEELRRALDELDRSNKELEQFTYVASHDLQEPLRKLISFSDLLKQDLGDHLPEIAARDMEFISDAAHRMQVLIQDLLALSRIGRAAVKHEPMSLDECVEAALEALSQTIKESGGVVTKDDLPTVTGDRTLLTQIYQNLIGNALKYCTTEAPRVHLTAEEGQGGWVLGVKDNGIGIRSEYLEQIFLPFKRLHTRQDYEGTGIGLSMCRKAVQLMGGRIWAESEGENLGSHFRFSIN